MTIEIIYRIKCQGPGCTASFGPEAATDSISRAHALRLRLKANEQGWERRMLSMLGMIADLCPACMATLTAEGKIAAQLPKEKPPGQAQGAGSGDMGPKAPHRVNHG